MNLKHLLESLIAEAMEDEKELIDTDKLPSALVIAKRIEEQNNRIIQLEEALQECFLALQRSTSNYDWNQQHHMDTQNTAEELLDSSQN